MNGRNPPNNSATGAEREANKARTEFSCTGDASERFDHASTLPRKPCLADTDVCRMYFVAGAGLIKIGISTNVKSRFRAIRNSSPVPVELVAVIRGNTHFEGAAHRKFAHLRRHGEWFEDAPEIREFIAMRLTQPAFNIESDYSWAAEIEKDRQRAGLPA